MSSVTSSLASSVTSTVSSTLSASITTFTSYQSSTSTSFSTTTTSGSGGLDRDRNSGSAQDSYGQSLSTFISSLLASLIIFALELWLYLVMRKRIRRVYEPKAYAVPKRQQVPPSGPGLFDWLIPTIFMPESDFIRKCGLDAYFFMRYLVMLIFIFFTASLIVLPILLPINSANTSSGTATGLDKLAWVNIGDTDTSRYWAHLILAVVYIIFLCAVFHHEMAAYVTMRQRYLISPQHRLRASATTVLIRAIPEDLCDADKIRTIFDVLPGGVRNVWINRNLERLSDKIRERDEVASKLETAETVLIQKAVKAYKKQLQKAQKSKIKADAEVREIDDSGAMIPAWKRYLKEKDRPKHNVSKFRQFPALPGFSKKVDTIEWCRKQLNELNEEIDEMQQDEKQYPFMNSCFIQFNNQIAAHMACQSLASDSPQYMVPRMIEINPNDVIWSSMRIKWWEALLRSMLTLGATGGLIVGWAFPVAFVGVISQLSYLTSALPFLDFINDMPPAIKGIVSGILPPAALAGLMALLPIILRLFATQRGASTGVQVEEIVQSSYFSFLFVQVFLVVTIASSITTVIQQLTQNPTSIPGLLASNLPKSSNFFFSYLILQGLTASAAALLRVGPLFMKIIVGPLVDVTARQKFTRLTTLSYVQWGTFYPIYTNLGAIGIVYTIISPLIMPMCLITFSLFYIAYRYMFIYCNYNQVDSAGLYFHRAINQLFTGVYVMELCLIGLFFLVRDENLKASCTPHAIIMIIVFFFTAIYQIVLNNSFGPHFTYLPISLEGRARLAMKQWEKANQGPLLASSSSARSYSAIESTSPMSREVSKGDLKKKVTHDDGISDVELQSQCGSELAPYATDLKDSEYMDIDTGVPLLQSPLGQLFTAFKKPITTTIESAPGRFVGEVGTSVGAQLENTANKLGISKRLGHIKNVTDFIYTGNDAAALEAELARNSKDVMLLEGVAEDLEDLSAEERDFLVNRAFRHEALRAKKPVVWIPQDDLGVAEDEIRITRELYVNVSISSDNAALNVRGKVVFGGRPPDYDIKSKIAL
ncbi:uncharacterized protein V1513DRAFT_410665 [Lipomyces chichibuensis]|uniref:uncharacterized protein n=1 Tax=Lipomyces chichibuensis TaxID=1546026 RepID=UPI00334319CD